MSYASCHNCSPLDSLIMARMLPHMILLGRALFFRSGPNNLNEELRLNMEAFNYEYLMEIELDILFV